MKIEFIKDKRKMANCSFINGDIEQIYILPFDEYRNKDIENPIDESWYGGNIKVIAELKNGKFIIVSEELETLGVFEIV